MFNGKHFSNRNILKSSLELTIEYCLLSKMKRRYQILKIL